LNSNRVFFIALLFLVCLFRYFFSGQIELIPDEAYYWGWSNYLSFGYYDHPPMVAIFIAISTAIVGETEQGIRLAAILSGLGITLISYRLGYSLFQSPRVGIYSAVFFNLILIFSLGSVIITPDTPLILFFALSLLFIYRAIWESKPYFWYGAGLAIGGALLSKYNGVLILPCLGLFILFSKNYKNLWKQKEPYIAMAIACVCFLPVILWNASHDWVSFRFQFFRGIQGPSINPILSFLEFLGAQALVVTPFIFISMGIVITYCYKLWESEKDDRFLFLFVFSVPIFLFFLVFSFQTKIQGNWPVMAYFAPTLALPGIYLTRGGKQKIIDNKILRFIKKWAIITVVLFIVLAHLQGIFRVVPLPPKTDVFLKKAYGWKQLGEYIGTFYSGLQKDGETFVFTDRHNIAAELSFYLPGKPQVFKIHGLKRYSYFGNLSHLLSKDGLYVFEEGRGNLNLVQPQFEAMFEMPIVSIKWEGKTIRKFRVFWCRGYRGNLLEI